MTASGRERLAREVGGILRLGVILSGATILLGLVPYLVRDGAKAAEYHAFRGEPEVFRTVTGVLGWASAAHPRGIVQLGVLLLLATPFARVALCLVEFVRARDRLYAAVSALVLAALVWGLVGPG